MSKNPEFGLLPQISGTFDDASKMLVLLRNNLENLIRRRHRIAQLIPKDYSAIPEFDPTNPRFRQNTNPVLEGKNFTKPVLKESTLRYPDFVSKSDRTVQIAANASQGLDEFFVSNLINPDYSFLRWQRFVSFTGLTRQFPAMYDPGMQDDRLTAWYNMATQIPKRVLFLLDISPSMKASFDLAKNIIVTILATLIPEDLVNIMLIDATSSSPRCFQDNGVSYLIPAGPANVQELRNFVSKVSIGAFESSMYEAISSAADIFQATQDRVEPAEAARAGDPVACSGHRCAPMFEHLFVVTDGRFTVTTELIDGLARLRSRRPQLQLFGVAVGVNALVAPVKALTCNLNGLTFVLPPPAEPEERMGGGGMGYASYILNELTEYYQMVAAPLARNHSQLADAQLGIDVTWDLPKNPYGSEIMITIALPCFGDTSSASPSLLGVVAVDLVWLKPGEELGDSLFTYWKNVVLPPVAGLDFSVVFARGHRGITLLDKGLVESYDQFLTSLEAYPKGGLRHYLWADFTKSGLKGSALLEQILNNPNGNSSILQERKARTRWNRWMFEAFLELGRNSTLAWAKLPGHPIVIILRAKGPLPMSGRHTITYISAETNLPAVCMDCWSFPNQNVLTPTYDTNSTRTRPGQSLLYIPVVGYEDSVTYLRSDVQQLPPACFTGNQGSMNTTSCRSMRLVRLMEVINNPNITYLPAELCGNGVMKQIKDEIYLTSVVDPLWEQTLAIADNREYIGRLLLSTPSGVFRTSAPPEKPPVTLPSLYQANYDPWYLRAVSSTGWGTLVITPPTQPRFDSVADGPVISCSVRVRHGYIPAHDQEESLAAVAAVMAVEVTYAHIHTLLYSGKSLRGSGSGSDFRCDGRIRCYLIDQNAAVIAHPDFMDNADNAGQTIRADFIEAQAAGRAIFFGNLEPDLMQMLADEKFMVEALDEDVTFTDSAYWGLMRTWSADPNRVPLVSAFGRGNVLVDSLPGTNAYLIIVDGYHRPRSLGGCGLISQECPAVFAPRIQDVVEDLCLSFQDRVKSNYRQASTVPLLDWYDSDTVIQAQRLFEDCPLPFPEWVWQLLLAGAGATVLLILCLSVQSALYARKRDLWITRRATGLSGHAIPDSNRTLRANQPTGNVLNLLEDVPVSCNADDAKIVKEMQTIRSAITIGREAGCDTGEGDAQDPRDFDKLKASILSLTCLLEKVASGKEVARDWEEAAVAELGEVVGCAVLSSQGLRGRLRSNCVARGISDNAIPDIGDVSNAIGGLKADLELLSRNMNEMEAILPNSRQIQFARLLLQAGGDVVAEPGLADSVAISSDRAREQQDQERSFYTRYYSHVSHFDSGHKTAGQARSPFAANFEISCSGIATPRSNGEGELSEVTLVSEIESTPVQRKWHAKSGMKRL